MPMVDPFTPDAFTLLALTSAIENLPYVPSELAASGLFNEQGVATLDVAIEERDGVLVLLDVLPRGAPGTLIAGAGRNIKSFRVPHIPARATLLADQVQGIRAFGSETSAEVLQARVNERLATMRRSLDYTIESHRVAAIQGSMYAANGLVTDLFTAFGVTELTHNMAFDPAASSSARTNALTAIELVESALDGVPFSGLRAYCDSAFWKLLIEDYDAKQTYLNTQMAANLRGDPRLSFDWEGIKGSNCFWPWGC